MSRPAVPNCRWLPALALMASLAATGSRASDRIIFDIYLLGLKAGELEIASAVGLRQYALAGRLESTGFVGAIRRVRYGGETRGQITAGRFVPGLYTNSTLSADRRSGGRMEYRNGVPQPKEFIPARRPEPQDVNPATQAGTLDPLTALFVALRDLPRGQACQAAERLFDGRRATRLRIVPVPGAALRCRGLYTRVAGYDADELAERRDFPFEMRLEPVGGDILRVAEITARTIYGRARLVRR